MLSKLIDKVLVSEEEISEIVSRVATEINRDYSSPDKKLVIVCVLKGSMMFTVDLAKKLTMPLEIEVMRVIKAKK